MILTFINVIYVLVAVAMIALILLQRGAGAAAGSGFGAGASATVFGARGASNFLSKSTAALASIFFVMSLGMAMYATRGTGSPEADLGIMGGASLETPVAPDAAPAAIVPAEVPAAPEASATPAPADDVPAASDTPDPASDSPAAPAEQQDNGG